MKSEPGKVVTAKEFTGPVCTVCHEEVVYPDWDCPRQPGHHQIAEKHYFHPGGKHIADRRDRRRFHLTLILKPATELFTDRGTQVVSPQVVAEFQDGKFTTTDPELQYYIDRDPEVKSGEEGARMWKEIYLTDAQHAQATKNELAALEAKLRQVREGAGLLDQVKASSI